MMDGALPGRRPYVETLVCCNARVLHGDGEVAYVCDDDCERCGGDAEVCAHCGQWPCASSCPDALGDYDDEPEHVRLGLSNNGWE